jgi:hypothetical protein
MRNFSPSQIGITLVFIVLLSFIPGRRGSIFALLGYNNPILPLIAGTILSFILAVNLSNTRRKLITWFVILQMIIILRVYAF